MKTCSKCGTQKLLSDFGKDRSRPDGRYLYCRECVAVYQKVIRKRHNAKRTEYNKFYRRENRESYNAWERAYYRKNSARLNAKSKAWRDASHGTFSIMHLSAKDRARRRNLTYALTPKTIKQLCEAQGNRCALTGMPFDYSKSDEFICRPFAPSLDRKDTSKGYTLDNVQITCVMVNKAKNEFHQEMFDAMCLARVRQINAG